MDLISISSVFNLPYTSFFLITLGLFVLLSLCLQCSDRLFIGDLAGLFCFVLFLFNLTWVLVAINPSYYELCSMLFESCDKIPWLRQIAKKKTANCSCRWERTSWSLSREHSGKGRSLLEPQNPPQLTHLLLQGYPLIKPQLLVLLKQVSPLGTKK